MIITKNEKNTYDITDITEYDVIDLCNVIDNAPLHLKRNLYKLKTGLEYFMSHQAIKKTK